MGDCEVCGAMGVTTRSTKIGRSNVEACTRCSQKMGANTTIPSNTPQSRRSTPQRRHQKKRSRNDIMFRTEKELRSDFAKIILEARTEKGWDQRELAKRMAERVNIIQHTESGKRPTDDVIKKFERILGITLLEEHTHDAESKVTSTPDRPMTLADYFDKAKEEL